MTKKETAVVVATLYEYYPAGKEGTNLQTKINAWHMILQDRDYKLIMAAVVAFVASDTKGFFPTPGALLAQLDRLTDRTAEMTELEAWSLVEKACRNGYYGYKEEYAKLPPNVQRAVGQAEQLREWAKMDEDVFKSVIASNFQRSYRARQKYDSEYKSLPRSVQSVVDAIKFQKIENGEDQASGMMIGSGKQDENFGN